MESLADDIQSSFGINRPATAIQRQLGLKLKSQDANIEILMVDHIDKPSAN